MNNKELKQSILSNSLTSFGFIMKYSDNTFLSKTYIEAIAKNTNRQIVYIESLNDVPTSDIFDLDTNIYVLIVDKYESEDEELPDNVIVICKETDKEYKNIIEMEAIKEWQILDYVKALVPGLDEAQVKWLCEVCKYNVYRLYNECSKLNQFRRADQSDLFNEISSTDGYSDLNQLTIFNFTNALLKRDYKTVARVLSDIQAIDIEGTGTITLLLNNFGKVISIQLNPNATPESTGMTVKQFNAVKQNVGRYSNAELIQIYDFLTIADYRLKNGEFQFKPDNRPNNLKFVDYIACNILSPQN